MNPWWLQKFEVDCRHFARSRMEPFLWLRDMGGRLSLQKPRVFGVSYEFLGDHWVGLCHLIRFRRYSRMPHRVALEAVPGMPAEKRRVLLQQIAKILGVEPELEFAEEPPELPLAVHPARNGETLQIPHLSGRKRETIAFQFDGVSQPHLNPTAEEEESILKCFEASSLRRVGRPLTLEESVEVLAGSRLLIGISSGMSHLAASTNTPSFIFLKKGAKGTTDLTVYKRLRRWNPYPDTRFFSNVGELKQLLAKANL